MAMIKFSFKNKEFLVVLFTLVLSLGILTGGLLYLNNAKFRKEIKTCQFIFKGVSTLTVGDPVKIAGIKVGEVLKKELYTDSVWGKVSGIRITVEIDKAVHVPDNSKVTIQNVGLMGERMVGIVLGDSPYEVTSDLPIWGTIDSGISEAIGMLGDLLLEVKRLLSYSLILVDATIGDPYFQKTLIATSLRIREVTDLLGELVQENAGLLNESVDRFSVAAVQAQQWIERNHPKIEAMLSELAQASTALVNLMQAGSQSLQNYQNLGLLIKDQKNTVGQLVFSEVHYQRTMKILNHLEQQLRQIRKRGVKSNLNFF